MSPVAIAAAIGGIVTALLTVAGTAVALGKILARLDHLSEQVATLKASESAAHELRQTVALQAQRITHQESETSSLRAVVAELTRAVHTLETVLARHTPDPEG